MAKGIQILIHIFGDQFMVAKRLRLQCVKQFANAGCAQFQVLCEGERALVKQGELYAPGAQVNDERTLFNHITKTLFFHVNCLVIQKALLTVAQYPDPDICLELDLVQYDKLVG